MTWFTSIERTWLETMSFTKAVSSEDLFASSEAPVPSSASSVSAIQSPDLRANESSTSYTNFISATERPCVSRRDGGCGS